MDRRGTEDQRGDIEWDGGLKEGEEERVEEDESVKDKGEEGRWRMKRERKERVDERWRG